jgi:hypothetical protein
LLNDRRFVETLAAETIRFGLQGRVNGSHLTSMHSMNNYYLSKLVGSKCHSTGPTVCLRPRRNSTRMAFVSAVAALTSSEQPTNLIP